MAKYQQGFPVNENGEIVTITGSGSRILVVYYQLILYQQTIIIKSISFT